MGIKQITTTIHTCDRCGEDGEVGVGGAFKDGHAVIRYVNKRATASTACSLYFCEACRDAFEKFLREKGRAVDPAGAGEKDDCG